MDQPRTHHVPIHLQDRDFGGRGLGWHGQRGPLAYSDRLPGAMITRTRIVRVVRRTFRRAAPPLLALSALMWGGCAPPDAPPDRTTEAPPGAPRATVYAPQNRPDVRGTHGAVSAGHPLAAEAGLQVLWEGGTATDAAVAMAAVLAVVRPHMNGVGGDAFALFYDAATGTVTALNGSGRSGALATPEFFSAQGLERIPDKGPLSVSVPGAVAAWVDAHARYGTMPLERLLAPAIRLARDGFPVSKRLRQDFLAQGGDLNEAGRALYLPGGGVAL